MQYLALYLAGVSVFVVGFFVGSFVQQRRQQEDIERAIAQLEQLQRHREVRIYEFPVSRN